MKVHGKFGLIITAATIMGLGACGTVPTTAPGIVTGVDTFEKVIPLPAGTRLAGGKVVAEDTEFRCGATKVARGGGLFAPGYILVSENPATSPTGDNRDLSLANQGLIKACGTSQIVYAGHTEPMAQFGVTKVYGAGDSGGAVAIAVQDTTAIAGAQAGAGVISK